MFNSKRQIILHSSRVIHHQFEKRPVDIDLKVARAFLNALVINYERIKVRVVRIIFLLQLLQRAASHDMRFGEAGVDLDRLGEQSFGLSPVAFLHSFGRLVGKAPRLVLRAAAARIQANRSK